MLIAAFTIQAQQKQDTVIIELAKTSRVIFTMRDKQDLEILKHYDFNELFKDILKKLESRDTTAVAADSTTQQPTIAQEEEEVEEDWSSDNDDDNNDNNRGRRRRGTSQSFNFDLGTNNYLADGKFPEADNQPYAVRPWGSWYVGIASVQRTRLSNKFFLEWSIGASWYNFKFEKDNVIVQKTDDGVTFSEDTRDLEFKKSKLTSSYVMASIVPVIDFGGSADKSRLWDNDSDAFRFGVGPYVGYRISSHSKMVYVEDGDREKDKERDNFYLNNFRYGLRLQIGYRSTDLFFNYDLNELFAENKGPKLNAFSFGVTF
ncbi:hypothetical protein DQQ10_24520 [Pseudochryseolinea flava]|uniref:Outer membrane protein beta-barrel domain-containing protein n=2 Tax=Pseudochryseolinea flava TaxID=2059302 RepID=A0A364XVV8_9BACT|nr:hypothetical protein DQQ10_24520 [Pseudochryseolinea flava]